MEAWRQLRLRLLKRHPELYAVDGDVLRTGEQSETAEGESTQGSRDAWPSI